MSAVYYLLTFREESGHLFVRIFSLFIKDFLIYEFI
ncbi:hypothetical protein EC847_105149 [Scandinavium goeteborgense]|uniref:Uncharacterized protein n=1 Tax=Scandinavium goeteborgense TaxID=1851514 RepID=A0A4R6EKP2_SCAGO|nr:hypothetical protein EC847_105149 [Scandinavium goeteborgense]